MTIDERFDKMAERHEGLAESVELLRHTIHEIGAKIDKLADHSGRLTTIVENQTTNVEALLTMVRIHEDRLRRIEGQQ